MPLLSLWALAAATTPALTSSMAASHRWAEAPPWEKKAVPDWAMVDAGACPIKRVKLASLEKLPGVPTIITDVAENWHAFKTWQNKTRFLEEFGDLPLSYSSIEGPLKFSMGNTESHLEKLRYFVQDMDKNGKQAFAVEVEDDPDHTGSGTAVHTLSAAAGTFKLPRSRFKILPQATLSIGGHGQGLPFHAHGSTWHALIIGMKVWFMYPPEMPQEAYETIGITPMKKWAERDYIKNLPRQNMEGGSLKGRPMRCLQQPGEIMWLPSFWWHATYNLGESLAVGSQHKLDPAEAKNGENKYSESSLVLHTLMRYLTAVSPLDDDIDQALEYGARAMEAAPYNPKIALDHAITLKKYKGDEAGARSIIDEYIAKVDKLLSDGMILPGEAEDAKQQLRHALDSDKEDRSEL